MLTPVWKDAIDSLIPSRWRPQTWGRLTTPGIMVSVMTRLLSKPGNAEIVAKQMGLSLQAF